MKFIHRHLWCTRKQSEQMRLNHSVSLHNLLNPFALKMSFLLFYWFQLILLLNSALM